MSSRIDVLAPATITVFSGSSISSLAALPPQAISLADPDTTGTISLQLVTANTLATIGASSLGGATVASNANTLSLRGNLAQINLALATLQITEPAGAASDTLLLSATDTLALPAHTAIAIDVASPAGPAFANPPAVLTLTPNALNPIAGLVIGDPEVSGLDQAGLGAEETLSLTLSAASGILLLPGLSSLDGIAAAGLGTGTLELTFTGDQLGAVNALLAELEFAGPAAPSGIAYSLRDVAGPLPVTQTNGNIQLIMQGTPGPNGSFTAGNQSMILGAQSFASGTTLAVTSATGDLGGITGAGALFIAPDAAFNLPYNELDLGGSSLDFGTLTATTFTESGNILIAAGAAFSGPILLGSGALLDFTGTLVGEGGAVAVNELAVSLAAGALFEGDGVLIAGNFSESGRISGPGTILAGGGDTLLLAAGSIGGGAELAVAAGGVMVLGPVSPLYGIFDPTPLTIDSSVTLAFTGEPGVGTIGGGYADTLDQSGGVFVISGPQAFSGSITGFAPGDRLIFPGLSNIDLFNVTANSFEVAGQDSNGVTQVYDFHANYQTGTQLYAGVDAEGDSEISLRDTGPDIFIGGQTLPLVNIDYSANISQPIQGFDIQPAANSSFGFNVTLSVSHGVLSDGSYGSGAVLTINTGSPLALNNALAGLRYTGTGQADFLIIASHSGALNGLNTLADIIPVSAGTLSGFGAGDPSAGQVALFPAASPAPLTGGAAPGEIVVSALTDFADALIVGGIGGTALLVDAGATAIFDAGAVVSLAGAMTIGDGVGAGSIDIITDDFLAGGNATIGGAAIGLSEANVSGALTVSGSLVLGAAAVTVSGSLSASTANIGALATLFADGGGVASFGNVADAGTIFLADQAVLVAASLSVPGSLVLGGTSRLSAQAITLGPGASGLIGPDATLGAASLLQTGGTLTDQGLISAGSLLANGVLDLAGGTIAATQFTIGGGALLAGYGVIEPAAGFTNAGTILAANGGLLLGGDVTNQGSIEIGTAASLDLVHRLTGGVVDFTGTGAELTINDLGVFTASVGNMTGSDVIDLVGIAPNLVSFASGSITASDTAGNRLGGFGLGVASGQPAVQIVSDNHGGALITLGDEMPCFARGTRLLTPAGYRPIEILQPGDWLITANGARRPVRWIGRRTLDLAGGAAARPVLITAGAFGPGLPARAVRLSPLHAVFAQGVLVPAAHLVNGATIIWEGGRAAVTYYHVELDRHDVVLAEGLACETYLDSGNRGPLYHEMGIRSPARRPFARRVTGGAKLAAIRRRLHEIALTAGFSLTYQPSLRAIVGRHSLLPEITLRRGRRVVRLSLPEPGNAVTLLSHFAAPADTDPDSEDRRELGICLAKAKTETGAGVRLGSGWYDHAGADNGIWMGRMAEILVPQSAAALTLSLAAVVQSWRPPATSTVGI